MRLLIVEDEDIVIHLLIACLKTCVEQPMVAKTKKSAMELLSRGLELDGILLDLGLPDSSGKDTFDAVRMMCPEVPIVVLSGSYDPDVHKMLADEGGTYLQKQEAADTPGKLCLEVEEAIKKYNNFRALKTLSLRKGMTTDATK